MTSPGADEGHCEVTARTSKRVHVVIVNYRCAPLTIDCLTSIADEVATLPGTTATVVDNASGDESVERISGAIRERGWSSWATLLPLDENRGFAAGNNAAIRPVLASAEPPSYVLLLNPDTVARPGAIAALVDCLEREPAVGVAGSYLEHADGSHQPSAYRFPSILGEIDRGLHVTFASHLLRRLMPPLPSANEEGPTDWVSGASMMVRREVFDAIGLLDDGYFLYYEEVDFIHRVRRAGWACWYVPSSRVVHLAGQSTGLTGPSSDGRRRVPAYWFHSRRRYFRKNLGLARTILADLAWGSSFALHRTRRFLFRRTDHDPEKLLADFLRHNVFHAYAGRWDRRIE